jgi:hypothetical protein
MQEHKMEAIEKRVVIVLADISGYTQFMVENQMSDVCGSWPTIHYFSDRDNDPGNRYSVTPARN